MSTSPLRILYCHCAFARVVPTDVKSGVLAQLAASNVEFEAVPDLCEMSARRDPGLAEIACGGDATIVACFPRAVQWLFNAAGTPLPSDVTVLNMRTSAAPEVAAALGLAPQVEAS